MQSYKYEFYAFIQLVDPYEASKKFCSSYSEYIVAVNRGVHRKRLEFGDGHATLHSIANGLHLHVEALDLTTLLGIKSLLQIGLKINSDQSQHCFK